jgi:hypothetical protein
MAEQERTILDWFDEGREARLCHEPKDANPYPPGEPSHDAWNRGWMEANDPDEKAKGYA